jgi:pSer/pThr/pTyr-binding forkhead associated (FHA) protein
MASSSIRFFDEEKIDTQLGKSRPENANCNRVVRLEPLKVSRLSADNDLNKPQLKPENTYLQILNGSKGKQRFSLSAMRIVIGRNDLPHVSVDIDLTGYEQSDVPMTSRRHALFQWIDGELQLVDLGSRNGTFVNGKQLISSTEKGHITVAAITTASNIKLADLEFEVVIDD